ncbi:unnamed protein product [Periconia digitata]|uniref:Uncharacterized protein n=1 Tax=Periconia digitata TaxID=1303443 RepID=A0A9W4XI73_9PLEO|nr:unnamed protein product [Periconia digitata]
MSDGLASPTPGWSPDDPRSQHGGYANHEFGRTSSRTEEAVSNDWRHVSASAISRFLFIPVLSGGAVHAGTPCLGEFLFGIGVFKSLLSSSCAKCGLFVAIVQFPLLMLVLISPTLITLQSDTLQLLPVHYVSS